MTYELPESALSHVFKSSVARVADVSAVKATLASCIWTFEDEAVKVPTLACVAPAPFTSTIICDVVILSKTSVDEGVILAVWVVL